MSERIQLFDLELKISFLYDIVTKAYHNFMFRFNLETKRCVLFKLLSARKKNQTTTFNISVFKREKRTNHLFFHDRKQKTNCFRSQKNKTLTSLDARSDIDLLEAEPERDAASALMDF
jgi:aminopeptidase C